MNFKRVLALGMTGLFIATSIPVLPAEAAAQAVQMLDQGITHGNMAKHSVRNGERANLNQPAAVVEVAEAPEPDANKKPGFLARVAQKLFFFGRKAKDMQEEAVAAVASAAEQAVPESVKGFSFIKNPEGGFARKGKNPHRVSSKAQPKIAAAVQPVPVQAINVAVPNQSIENIPVEAPRLINPENIVPKQKSDFQPEEKIDAVRTSVSSQDESPTYRNNVLESLNVAQKVIQQQQKQKEYGQPEEEAVNFAGVEDVAMPARMISLPTSIAANVPTLENTASTDNVVGQGDVKVLRSGIATNLNEIDLTMGKAVVLNLSQPAARISISDPAIANAVVLSPTQVQLVGLQVGVANLLLWGNPDDKEHTVIDISVHRDVSVLVRQLHFVDPGIQIVPLAAEDTVIMTGQANSREASQLAVEMARAFFRDSAAGATSRSSAAPGTAVPGSSPNVINLIKVKGEPSTKLDLVRQKLNAIDPDIKLDIVPSRDGSERVILTGQVRTASMVSKAVNLASVFYGEPGLRVLTGPGGSAMRETPGDAGFQTADRFSDNKDINILQGSIVTDSSGNVISMLEVAYRPQIRCSVQFLEISKTGLESLGHTMAGIGGAYGLSHRSGNQSGAPGRPISVIDNTDSGNRFVGNVNREGSGAGRNTLAMGNAMEDLFQQGVTQVLSINEQISVAIQALEENRKARSLAEPTLTMLSGEKASFLAGGEVPIAATSANGQVSIQFKEFGIRLNLVGTVTDDGKIHMQIGPEVSSIDPTINAGGFPGFRTRRMQTTLDLENQQSFLLAGLYSQDDVYSSSAFPWLGDLPVVGSFFRNKWNSKANSELVVIIKPEIIEGPFSQ